MDVTKEYISYSALLIFLVNMHGLLKDKSTKSITKAFLKF